MIRLILKGGLGNQMFQYASAYALSKTLNTDLLLDTTFLDTHLPVKHFTKRSYELDLFSVESSVAAASSRPVFNRYFAYALLSMRMYFGCVDSFVSDNKWYAVLDKVLKRGLLQAEPDLTTLSNLQANSYLESYLNDYRLFESHAKEIRKIYDTDKLFDSAFKDIEAEILSRNSVSVNIRRGDYLNPKTRKVLRTLDDSYYITAVKIIKDRVKNPHFFIFSYDYPDGMDNPYSLSAGEYTLLGPTFVGDRFKTYLRLVSLCKHNILSNSTFSFWGGYLNNFSEKVVVAPSHWDFKSSVYNYPSGWETVSVV